jgi:hypothetical protein
MTIVMLSTIVSACGGSSPTAPPSVVPQPAPAVSSPAPAPIGDLTGTWQGTGSGGGASFTLTWVLQQSGASVTGTSHFTDGNGFVSGQGRVTATYSGNTLVFTDEYPVGALVNPACSETDAGTLTVGGSQMQGGFRSASSCGRTETGTVTLTR